MIIQIGWIRCLLMLGLVCVFGCYQRSVGPEVNYSESDVEKIRSEINRMEWD